MIYERIHYSPFSSSIFKFCMSKRQCAWIFIYHCKKANLINQSNQILSAERVQCLKTNFLKRMMVIELLNSFGISISWCDMFHWKPVNMHNTPKEKLKHLKAISYQKFMHRKIIAWETYKFSFRMYFSQLIICFHFEHQSNTCYNKLFKMQIAIKNVWLKLVAIITGFYNIYTCIH